jgi:hypothetical protein
VPETRRRGVRRTVGVAAAGALTLSLLPSLSASAQTAPTPRATDAACPADPTSDFPDIAGSAHEDNIRCIADRGIAQGKADGTYAPRDRVRRDQMATFVVNTVESATGETLPGGDDDAFPDVPDDNVHREAINKLRASGWIQGRPGGVYEPAGDVTRGQMARFIGGAISFLDDGDGTNDSQPPATAIPYFPDTVGSPFQDDIDRLAEQGIVGGFEDGTYRPSADVRRDQMASFIARGLDFAITEGLVADLPPGFEQTSRFTTEVTPEQVVDEDGAFRQGEPGSAGTFDLRLDSVSDTICYDITLQGVSGDYSSPAATATHIHDNDFGLIGPPVVAFENPQPVDADDPDGLRRSSGCVDATAPAFDDGRDDDPGEGFQVSDLEADPEAYYLDTHTADFVGGAVRGQLGTTDQFDVSLSWHDEVDDSGDTPLFGTGEPGAEGDALLVLTDESQATAGTADDGICFAITSDATAPFVGAHLHQGAVDENGPVEIDLAVPDADGVATGCTQDLSGLALPGLDPDPDFAIADVIADEEDHYINVHTEDFAAGAVRGQLPMGTFIADGDVTSTWSITADPDQVVGAGGEQGATAQYELTFDSAAGVVCYDVTTDGVSGDYSSPAVTANHIHEAPAGVAGPPRVAFANPVPVDGDDPDGVRTSSGCAVTPQLTGTAVDGVDNGLGATLADVEADPADYYVDVHTEEFVPGAVRGQFADAFEVTSRFSIEADALQVVADGEPAAGEPGATGTWDLRMDEELNLICYAIELDGVSGDYESPALTATHIHEGEVGVAGPAPVAFANPVPIDDSDPDGLRRSSGCVDAGAASFPDGAMDPDPGVGFQVSDIEDDPSEYYVDTHTEDFPAGAVRGQFGAPVDLPGPLALDAGTWTDTVADTVASDAPDATPAATVGQNREAPEGTQVSAFGCHFEAV